MNFFEFAAHVIGGLFEDVEQGGASGGGAGFFHFGEAQGAVVEVFFEDLRDAIWQGADAVGAEAEGATTADAGELAGQVGEALGGLNGGGEAQDVADEAANGF
ncbi:hypothetical protein SDC9_68715 [bioreactor metagenome]|uniref:Uncharacterized protein n=1 Tax=bioreactor metagenome TaxID=1076179 RepID=A0A644Y813_9ZZZZ